MLGYTAFLSGAKNYTVSSIIYSFQTSDREDNIKLTKTDDNITGVVILLDKLSSIPFKENPDIMPVIKKEKIILFNDIKSEFNSSMNTRSATKTRFIFFLLFQ